MKKIGLIIILLIASQSLSAQKKEKIKGSKIVTIEQKNVDSFAGIEVDDNLEIFIIKGTSHAIEVEADDNLHEAIIANVLGGVLQIRTSKNITSYKKLSLRVTYTDELKTVTLRNNATVTALAEVQLEDITFKSFDNAKLFLNVNCNQFSLIANDKTKAELNIKSQSTKIELSKNAQVKALINSPFIQTDMYQKTSAVIEGDTENLQMRLDNNASFTGKNLTAKEAVITTEGLSKAGVMITQKTVVKASGRSEIYFYGDGKIELEKFSDDASIYKKSK